jgi:hypothetical protein
MIKFLAMQNNHMSNIPLPFLDLSFLQLFPEGNHLSLQIKLQKLM